MKIVFGDLIAIILPITKSKPAPDYMYRHEPIIPCKYWDRLDRTEWLLYTGLTDTYTERYIALIECDIRINKTRIRQKVSDNQIRNH